MKKTGSLIVILGCIIGLSGCGSKSLKFTGQEDADQTFKQCLKLSEKKQFKEAVDCLEIFKSRFPDSNLAAEAELRVADSYFNNKEYLLAAETYRLFTKSHPKSEKIDYAYHQIGLSYLKEAPKKIDRDQKYLVEAANSFLMLLDQFPNSSYASDAKKYYDEARLRVAKRHFYIGKHYFHWNEFRAAAPRFEEVYQKFAGLGLDEEAMAYAIRCYQKIGRLDEAKQIFKELEAKFPNGEKTQKLRGVLDE